ncbi:MAG: AI-2E family transporter [Rhodocyclaceae bacterium]|nr:AI-2E family transporter [Rhodocyclaceae bacterium]
MSSETNSSRVRIASYLLAAVALVTILAVHLLASLFAGLLVFELVHVIAPRLEKHFATERGRLIAVALLSALVVGGFILAVIGAIAFFRSDAGNLAQLSERVEGILHQIRASTPDWLIDTLPISFDQLQQSGPQLLRDHAAQLQKMGMNAAIGFAHVVFGMIIGAVIAIQETTHALNARAPAPLVVALTERVQRLADAFRRVVFAQVRISAINTTFTAIYLMVALPLFGVHLPLTKTMIAITFLVGLLPVIGNLISNTVILLVSLAHSPQVAISSLTFLVVVHKLEYFLNAKIVGGQINARIWELITAMLLMEAIFGLPGLVAAPVVYAWVKEELTRVGLV